MNDNRDSYTQHYMIDFEQAFEIISNHSQEAESENCQLAKASGRILAAPITSPMNIPSFDNSAMDGYAVNADDLNQASLDTPVNLNIVGLTAAGDDISQNQLSQKTAWKIMTGAPIPQGYDSVIPVEKTKQDDQDKTKLLCFAKVIKGAHCRTQGEDFVKDQLVLEDKQLINSNRIMALASLGIAQVPVKRKIKIAVFSTGKELIDDPNQPLKPGQIRNSNMPYILDYLSHFPVKSINAGTNYDDVDAFKKALQQQLDDRQDIIISTGAVSMGDFDFIPKCILALGGEILFHKIKIRPGKPILFAKFPNGSYYFGLPGNPISATLGLRFFVSHLLLRLWGLPNEKPLKTQLESAYIKKKGFTLLLKSNLQVTPEATLKASILDGQESFKIHPMLDANGWLKLTQDTEQLAAATILDFYPSIMDLNQF
ncbi:MAG: molybdopterin molybdotransferase MoeA [Enterobacterales bacterium]|nr:molybdopterin molybdotransferase MoeA [Enterobacterales bacterium]